MKRQAATRKPKPKPKALSVHGFKVRERRPGVFVLQVRRQGITLFETFHDEAAARLRCEQLQAERTRHGLSAFELSASTRRDATEAAALLAGRATLTDAAAFWFVHHPDGSATTLQELAALYLADLERRNCRPATLAGMRHRLGRLCVDHGDRAACTVTTDDLLQWLEVRGGGPVSRNNFRRAFRAAFNFARKRGIVTLNPIDGIDPTQTDQKMPKHWNAAHLETVLRSAQAFAPRMVPFLAVQAFAGLRPDEAAGLHWENVNLSEGHVRVMPETSKVRKARLAEMPDSLKAWLMPHRKTGGRVSPGASTVSRWRVRLAAAAVLGADEVRRRLSQHGGKRGTEIKAAGLGWTAIVRDARTKAKGKELWPHDVLRHSYATHWLPLHHDKVRLASLMGNSPDIIEAHYKALATPKEAEAYFALVPTVAGRLVRMPKRRKSA